MKKVIKEIKRKVVNKSIRFMSNDFLRSTIIKNLDLELPILDKITFKIARTKKELEQALKLLQKSYLAENYTSDDETSIRMTPYHVLPTSSILIGLYEGRVIATLTLIGDNDLGLPCQKIADFPTHINKNGKRVAEISSLALDYDFRNNGGSILLTFVKYAYYYAKDYLNASYFAIATHPQKFPFYELMFGAESIDLNLKDEKYNFVNGAAVKVGIIDIGNVEKYLYLHFHKKNKKKNVYQLFTDAGDHHFEYPSRENNTSFDFVWTPELLDHFFNSDINFLHKMNSLELTVLKKLFLNNQFKNVIPQEFYKSVQNDFDINSRKNIRCAVNFPCRLIFMDQTVCDGLIINASKSGFAISTGKHYLKSKGEYKVLIEVSKFNIVEIKAKIVQIQNFTLYGFSLSGKNILWEDMISQILGPLDDGGSIQVKKAVA